MRTVLSLPFVLTACVASSPPPPARAPLGVAQNLEEAERHEADAAALERQAQERAGGQAAPDAGCGDPVLADQVTSGGERVMLVAPCWSSGGGTDPRLREAAALRADAATHRTRAAALVEAEGAACAAFTEDERDDSAFLHLDDVVSVVAIVEQGRLRGATVRFRAVDGLTAPWMRASIACQQARGEALGWDPTHATFDPTVLSGADAWVTEARGGEVQVEITSDDPATALIVYHRAERLLSAEE